VRTFACILLAALAAAAGPARGADSAECGAVSLEAYGTIPLLFFDDQPDSLIGVLIRWEQACGPQEVTERTRILAAIWDGNFDESLYDPGIIDDLVAYAPRVAREPDLDEADPRTRYDAFTRDLADQLLPHTDQGSLESFFCLFYSGRTAEAWTLLRSDTLQVTELARLYRNELEILDTPKPTTVITITGGGWSPGGNQAFVGDKTLAGAMVGLRGHDWLGRAVLEMRIGRSARPYVAPVAGEDRPSDRFDAALAVLEAGRIIRLGDHVQWDLFGGLGVDAVKPFKADDLTLNAFHAEVGTGLRLLLGPDRLWLLGVDGRREWVTDRNDAGTPMGGSAWSLRVAVGIQLDGGRSARRRALMP